MATQPKYGMVIDASRCFNCKACIISCQLENGVPPEHSRDWIKDLAGGPEKPQFQPGNCMQCDEPSCVAACPVPGATYKSKTSIVLIDPSFCINCGNCIPACPYGARYRHPGKKAADKCDFCSHRLKKGLEPACVVTCPTRARVFGDLNDPKSEVSRMVKEGNLLRLVDPKVDTKPNIFYLKGTVLLTWPKEPTLPGEVRMPLSFWRTYRSVH